MEITVTIPDELAAQVQARGFALETYLRNLVEERLSEAHAVAGQHRKAVEDMLQFAEKHGVLSGGQEIKSMLHEGHKY